MTLYHTPQSHDLSRRSFVALCAGLFFVPSVSFADGLRLAMAQKIVDFEARRDASGALRVYRLPLGDGGGRYEVAGINQRYHRAKARRLRWLIWTGRAEQAEREAVDYIADKTDHPADRAKSNAIKFVLRDIAWNRGPTGAVRTLQIALGVTIDGKFGPATTRALRNAERSPRQLLKDIEAARETYERDVVGRNGDSIFWEGLRNRWKKATAHALTYL